jgi:tetratricopeptide (TPR) repeat protein
MRAILILVAFTMAALAQRHKMEEVDTAKPEGQLLQQIMQENDPSKKAALMEQFAGQFPKVEGTPWVLEQLQTIYVKANDPDKILAAGDKLLALDPGDPEAGLQCLKAAEAKKDAALIKKYASSTSAAARKVAEAPQPKEADDAATWKQEVDYAKQVDTYTEYALYRAALESRDPKMTIDLCETLSTQSPKSEYAAKASSPLFLAYRQSGANDKAIALAEKTLATEQTNEQMMLAVMENYIQNKKEPDKVHVYGVKVVELMGAAPKPEGISDADWTARKTSIAGLAHYFNGKLYFDQSNFSKADAELRGALPMTESNPALKPEVLFMLGTSNYKMQKAQEAADYYRQCAALKSPMQATATKNLQAIKNEYRGIK